MASATVLYSDDTITVIDVTSENDDDPYKDFPETVVYNEDPYLVSVANNNFNVFICDYLFPFEEKRYTLGGETDSDSISLNITLRNEGVDTVLLVTDAYGYLIEETNFDFTGEEFCVFIQFTAQPIVYVWTVDKEFSHACTLSPRIYHSFKYWNLIGNDRLRELEITTIQRSVSWWRTIANVYLNCYTGKMAVVTSTVLSETGLNSYVDHFVENVAQCFDIWVDLHVDSSYIENWTQDSNIKLITDNVIWADSSYFVLESGDVVSEVSSTMDVESSYIYMAVASPEVSLGEMMQSVYGSWVENYSDEADSVVQQLSINDTVNLLGDNLWDFETFYISNYVEPDPPSNEVDLYEVYPCWQILQSSEVQGITSTFSIESVDSSYNSVLSTDIWAEVEFDGFVIPIDSYIHFAPKPTVATIITFVITDVSGSSHQLFTKTYLEQVSSSYIPNISTMSAMNRNHEVRYA